MRFAALKPNLSHTAVFQRNQARGIAAYRFERNFERNLFIAVRVK
ncbi:hypothetical protein [Neisseria iguanae]|nr:hypothetical protein [Neisseria iguanae]